VEQSPEKRKDKRKSMRKTKSENLEGGHLKKKDRKKLKDEAVIGL